MVAADVGSADKKPEVCVPKGVGDVPPEGVGGVRPERSWKCGSLGASQMELEVRVPKGDLEA